WRRDGPPAAPLRARLRAAPRRAGRGGAALLLHPPRRPRGAGRAPPPRGPGGPGRGGGGTPGPAPARGSPPPPPPPARPGGALPRATGRAAGAPAARRGAPPAPPADPPVPRLDDQDTRDRIHDDLDTTLVVEAASGTGKTTELVTRMVALLTARRAHLHETVA